MPDEAPRTKGQRHRTRAEAAQIAVEYEASGLTQQEYSERNGVALKTLARYVARHRRASADKAAAPQWLAVEVSARREIMSDLQVLLPSGYRIEVKPGFDSVTLRQLVSVLEQR